MGGQLNYYSESVVLEIGEQCFNGWVEPVFWVTPYILVNLVWMYLSARDGCCCSCFAKVKKGSAEYRAHKKAYIPPPGKNGKKEACCSTLFGNTNYILYTSLFTMQVLDIWSTYIFLQDSRQDIDDFLKIHPNNEQANRAYFLLEDKYQLIMGVQILNALMTQMAIYYKYQIEKPNPDTALPPDDRMVKLFVQDGKEYKGRDGGYVTI